MAERAFAFIRMNQRQSKPRKLGVTEIRGPYYTPWVSAISKTSWRLWGAT
jgi:hypothetical protein